MNTVILIVFGILVPVCFFIGNTLQGSNTERKRALSAEWAKTHPICTVIGWLVVLIPPIFYWIVIVILNIV